MSTKKLKRKYFSNYFLILCCLTFCLSACITGEITCEKCESGKITIEIIDCNTNPIVEKTLDGCGTYSILIPPTHIGKQVLVAVHCDEDNDGEFSIGDYSGRGEWFELQLTNEVNIDINREFTATIEGEVSCIFYTSGLIHVYAFDGPTNEASPPSYIGGPYQPVNLGVNASYKVTLYETPIGSEVWLFGHWDKDGSGACQGEETLNECDYGGRPVDNEWNRNPIPIILDSEEMTGVDFNCCQFQILPCLE